jgi:hypothetical protein
MPELLRNIEGDVTEFRADTRSPFVDLRFTKDPFVHMKGVNSENSRFVASGSNLSLRNFVRSSSGILVMKDFSTGDTTSLHHTGNRYALSYRSGNSEESPSTIILPGRPKVTTSFDENLGLFLTIAGANDTSYSATIPLAEDTDFMVLGGRFESDGYEYQHIGGRRSQGAVSKDDKQAFESIESLIKGTEEAKRKGKEQTVYYVGDRNDDRISYSRIYPEETRISPRLLVVDPHPFLVQVQGNWFFRLK